MYHKMLEYNVVETANKDKYVYSVVSGELLMLETSTQRSYFKRGVFHRDPAHGPAVELVKNGGIEYQWWVDGKYIKSSISRCTRLTPIDYGIICKINDMGYRLSPNPLYKN